MFLVEVPDRTAQTLLSIIEQHVAPGSIVLTDLWSGYFGLSQTLHMQHLTVNHSLYFRDPSTGVHTNTIEGTWNGIKMRIPPRMRVKGKMNLVAGEMMWRRANERDLWGGFVKALQDVSYE